MSFLEGLVGVFESTTPQMQLSNLLIRNYCVVVIAKKIESDLEGFHMSLHGTLILLWLQAISDRI
jgi:hypothetical protein